MIEKILFVSDGIIAVVGNGLEIPDEPPDNVALAVTKFGAVLSIYGLQVSLPVSVLEHLEQADGTNIYFYTSEPYTLVATYRGFVVLERDEVVKVKGAWDYVSSLPTDVGSISGNE